MPPGVADPAFRSPKNGTNKPTWMDKEPVKDSSLLSITWHSVVLKFLKSGLSQLVPRGGQGPHLLTLATILLGIPFRGGGYHPVLLRDKEVGQLALALTFV